MSRRLIELLVLAVVVLVATGCIEQYDFERDVPERGTLGEELFDIWRKDAARSADKSEPKTELLDQRRAEFVDSVDAIAPPDTLTEVDHFMRDLNNLIDSGLLVGLTRKLIILLDDARHDDALIEGFVSNRRPDPETYVSPENQKNFLGHLMNYSRLPEVATRTSEVLLANDGMSAEGTSDGSEGTSFYDLQLSLSATLREASAEDDPTDSLAYSLRDVLLAEDPRFAPADAQQPLYAVRFDRRGYPVVVEDGGELRFPFVDDDADGLADVNSEGKFILETGDHRRIEPFVTDPEANELLNRDAWGRGYSNENEFSFEYIDLNETGLSFLVRQIGFLSARGFLWDLVESVPTVMGDKVVKEDEYGPYAGYPVDNPMVDAMYAMFHMLDHPRLHDIGRTLANFMDAESPALAGVMHGVEEMTDAFADHPDAEMTGEQTLGYDMLPIIEQLAANQALWHDVMGALSEPITRKTGLAMAEFVKYADNHPMKPQLGGPYDQCFQDCKSQHEIGTIPRFECIRACPADGMFSESTDFDAPESIDNRSLFARLLHLLRDTHDAQYDLRITEPGWASGFPPIVRLDDSAGAFIRSVGGHMDMENHVPDDFWDSGLGGLLSTLGVDSGNLTQLLSALSPIFGVQLDKEPTPDQITRLFNQPEITGSVAGITISVEAPYCHDGYKVANHHSDMLYAAEASGLIDTLHPLAAAFSAHDREDLLARLFVVMHDHYASRDDLYTTADGSASPMKAANLVSYEPAFLEIFENGKLFDGLTELGQATDRFENSTGSDINEMLRLLVYNAVRSDEDFETRDGFSTINLADGRTVQNLSKMHVFARAMGQLSDRLDAEPEAREHFDGAMETLHDTLLATSWPDGETPYFESQGTVALLVLTLRHLSEEATELLGEGRLSEWLTVEQVDAVEEMFDSRGMPAGMSLGQAMFEAQENRELTEDLVTYLVSGERGRAQASMGAYVLLVTSLHTEAWVPLAQFLGGHLDPQRTWQTEAGSFEEIPRADLPLVSHLLTVLRETVEQDPEGTGLDMFARGFGTQRDGSIPFPTVFGIIADYFREDPASDQPYSADDYRHVFGGFTSWLADDVHGMEQLYDIVDSRVK